MRLLLACAGLAVLPPISPASAAAPLTHMVVIDNMKFGPMPAQVRAGDRIIWVNRDIAPHTATAKDGSFNVDLAPGTRKAIAVRRASTTTVICRYHPGMRAILKVGR